MKESVYIKNFNKLLKYAESMHIKVIYSDVNADAQWSPISRTITLSHSFKNDPKEIALFLHELGHARDDFSIRDRGYVKYIDLCYKRFNKLTLKNQKKVYITNNQKMTVIYTEHRAWENGIDIAKQLKIKLGKWYYEEMNDGLKNYFEYAFPNTFEQKFKDFLNE